MTKKKVVFNLEATTVIEIIPSYHRQISFQVFTITEDDEEETLTYSDPNKEILSNERHSEQSNFQEIYCH